MKYAAPLFLAFLFCTTTALAADHLKPEDSIYSGGSFEPGYDQAMVASFEDAFADDVLDRVIVQPSFETEFAVGVKEDKDRYRIFYQEVSEQLWQYTVLDLMKKGQITSVGDNGKSTTQDDIAKLEKSLPPDPKDVKVNRCEYDIDPAFGAKLAGAWADVLLEHVIPKSLHWVWTEPFSTSMQGETISAWPARHGVPIRIPNQACSRTSRMA